MTRPPDEMNRNQITKLIEFPEDTDTLQPAPDRLAEPTPGSLTPLRRLKGASVVSVRELDREQVIALCRLAAALEAVEITPYETLRGKILITAFFEASTRTRTSFESAFLRLDGKVISIPEGNATGAAKGESIADMGEMFNAYGDLVVLRHTETTAPEQMLEKLRVPLINAGNGSGEHPTQALADWYALLKWRPELATPGLPADRRLNLGILGTPGSMRAVKSFLLMSLLMRDAIAKVTVVSEMADPFGAELADDIKSAGIEYEVTNDIHESLPTLDVIYMNSIAFLGDSYKTLDSRYKLDADSNLKDDAVILHPLARLDELSTDLDDTRHNLYFSQAHGAVFVRQALLLSVLDRLDRLPETLVLPEN